MTGESVFEPDEDAFAEAEAEGCEVVYGSNITLMLDFDGPEGVAQYKRLRDQVDKHFGIVREEWWVSKSGGEHRHCRVTLEQGLDEGLLLALECALGSDPYRTIMGSVRLKKGIGVPRRLFRPKDVKIEVWNRDGQVEAWWEEPEEVTPF